MASEIAAPKPDGSRRQSEKKTILKHFLKGILKGKLLAPKLGKSADKWLSQPGCSHSNTIYNLQLQKTIVLRMQPRRQATLTQPFQCDLQAQIPKHPITTHTQAHPKQLEATVTLRQKKTINRPQPHPPHRRGTFHRRLQPLYTEKHKVSCSGFLPKTEPLQHHAAIPMRSASTDSKTPYNYAHTSTPKAAWSHRYTAAKKTINRPQPHPPHRRGTFHRRLQPLYTEKQKVSCSGFLPKTEPLQHHAAIPMRSASTDSKTPYNYAHTSTPKAAWSQRYTAAKKKTTNRPQPHPPHRRGTFHRRLQPLYTEKRKVSCSGFLPTTEPLQHHAAIPMRSASTDSKTPYNYAHTSTPKAAWSHRYTAAKKTINRPQPHPPHRRGTFHRRLQPLYTEKHKVSCSGFLPKTKPLQHHAAIPMRSASTDSKTPYNYAHTSTPKAAWSHRYTAAKKTDKPTAAAPAAQTRYLSSSPAATLHGKTQGFVLRLPPQNRALATSCGHSNAICKHCCTKHPITTHTQAHPKQLEATVTLRQKKTINRPQPHPPHRRGTFHRRLQPLYTEKHKVSCSGFLPKTEPLQHHAAIPMRSASTDSKTPYNYAHTSTPKAAWSHRYTAAKKKR